jgi:hypothetical protein
MQECMEESWQRFVSSCIRVHSKANMSHCWTYLLPNKINMEMLHIEASPDGIGRWLLWKLKNEGQEYVRELEDKFHCESPWDLTYIKSATEFNDMYVGNLEYVCTLIGMNNCAGSSCTWCELQQGLFGIGKGNERTRETINATFQTHLQNRRLDDEKGVTSKTKPVHGVQLHWFLNIDPWRYEFWHCMSRLDW